MKAETINYKGWKDSVRLSNGVIQLVVTTQIGPRIIHFGSSGGENLFYVNPAQAGSSGGEEWKIYGGHRLWCAPEVKETTYAADNFPVQFEYDEQSARFTAPVEPCGIQKVIEMTIEGDSSRVNVKHTVINQGKTAVSLAPWAISVMKPGGTAVIPHNLGLPDQYLPTHSISLWNYTRLTDPRLTLGNHFILIRQDAAATQALKIGGNNRYGWAGYAMEDSLFVKRFNWEADASYLDFNSNFESYTNSEILEMESLAPLTRLEPGESAIHPETWELYSNIPVPTSERDVFDHILPVIENKRE